MPRDSSRHSLETVPWEIRCKEAYEPFATTSITRCNDKLDYVNLSSNRTKEKQRSGLRRKGGPNHIPRPANAFMLFRSSFIKNKYVSPDIETNHGTLSKIAALTWKNLPEADRQYWFAMAQIAREDHKHRFPQYVFSPVHRKSSGIVSERRKVREVPLQDEKRCAKISQLLSCGKRGHELKEGMEEFDQRHIPEIVVRFDTPLTSSNFKSTVNINTSQETQHSFNNSSLNTPDVSSKTTSHHITHGNYIEPEALDHLIQLPSLYYDVFAVPEGGTHSFDIDPFPELGFQEDLSWYTNTWSEESTITTPNQCSSTFGRLDGAHHTEAYFLDNSTTSYESFEPYPDYFKTNNDQVVDLDTIPHLSMW